jgi:hypothetical protein
MALDERDFFNNRNDTRVDQLTCPRCRRTNDYQMRWVVRVRKDRIPPGADERDRALYAKLRDYMIRIDDVVTCKTCGKKFDIPSQHSMVFLQKGEAQGQGQGQGQARGQGQRQGAQPSQQPRGGAAGRPNVPQPSKAAPPDEDDFGEINFNR